MGRGTPKIVVVGAGIIGASIAYNLARRGAAVTVIDGGHGVQVATARSFAWINAWSGASEAYARLRHHSMQEYRRLQNDLNGALPLKWSGTLVWKPLQEDTERRARDQAAAGYDVRLVGPNEIASIEPDLQNPPPLAAHAAGEGSVEPEQTMQLLLEAARDHGAQLIQPAKAERLVLEGGTVTGVMVAGEVIEADCVILAAGTGTQALAATADVNVPLEASPALLARFRSRAPLIRTIVINPDLEVRQISDRVIVGAADYIDDSVENGPDAVAGRMLAQIRKDFAASEHVQTDSVQVGWRPMPADGMPVVGFAPGLGGLYLSIMHSGITLAPAIGRFAATEILDGIEVKMLDICRPERFQD